MNKKEHHILSLSGGKDSTALAFFIKDHMPELFKKIELVFADTEYEIPETYDYLNKIEVFLNKKITRLKPLRSFEHIMLIYNHLPSITQRWCTVELKTKVFQNYINTLVKSSDEKVYMYIGIRADEHFRTASSIHNKNNIIAVYPFVENGLIKNDIDEILEKNGIGYSDYYKWRKRSGCYFCFFQSKNDWLNLYDNHPDLYLKAMQYEIEYGTTNRKTRFGWNTEMSLKDMIKPQNIKKIREDYNKSQRNKSLKSDKSCNKRLFDLF